MLKKAYLSALALLAAFLFLPSAGWTQAEILYQQELGLPDRAAFSPEVAVSSEGEVYVVWLDRPDPTGPPPKRKHGEHSHRSSVDLWISRSDDGGSSFQAPAMVNHERGVIWGFQVSKPRVSIDNVGTVHIFYPGNALSTETRLGRHRLAIHAFAGQGRHVFRGRHAEFARQEGRTGTAG